MNGLGSNAVKEYWDQRAEKHGKLTTTLAGSTAGQAEHDYAVRRAWLFPRVPRGLATLDYGCGVGWYSTMFTGAYVGADICDRLIAIARERHPDKEYIALGEPSLPIHPPLRFGLVFTATVLQHNDDESVRRILASIRHHHVAPDWAIYENTEDQSAHVCGRTPTQYVQLVEEAGFPVGSFNSFCHRIHKAQHALTIITP